MLIDVRLLILFFKFAELLPSSAKSFLLIDHTLVKDLVKKVCELGPYEENPSKLNVFPGPKIFPPTSTYPFSIKKIWRLILPF